MGVDPDMTSTSAIPSGRFVDWRRRLERRKRANSGRSPMSSERVKSIQSAYAFIATSVRFLAFIFFMTLRTCTFTVLKHMFNSWAMILFDFPS
jgi:hypothetical protein